MVFPPTRRRSHFWLSIGSLLQNLRTRTKLIASCMADANASDGAPSETGGEVRRAFLPQWELPVPIVRIGCPVKVSRPYTERDHREIFRCSTLAMRIMKTQDENKKIYVQNQYGSGTPGRTRAWENGRNDPNLATDRRDIVAQLTAHNVVFSVMVEFEGWPVSSRGHDGRPSRSKVGHEVIKELSSIENYFRDSIVDQFVQTWVETSEETGRSRLVVYIRCISSFWQMAELIWVPLIKGLGFQNGATLLRC